MLKKAVFIFILFINVVNAQDKEQQSSFVDVNYFTGNIALHNTDIQHLITGHPEGFIIGWNKKTFGGKEWEQRYNYPDYGASYSYQNFKNEYLGQNHALYAHYNFYFLNRNLMMRIGQGLAYTSAPYDNENNFRNVAFGSRILSSTMLMLNYKKERLLGDLGIQAGLSLIHYSNANVKAPNTSVNSVTFNVGVNYKLDKNTPVYADDHLSNKFTERMRVNFVFRAGLNESDQVNSGQFPFYVFSVYADKRLNKKSAVQLGTDIFYSNFLKQYARYRAVASPHWGISEDDDYKRTGLFVGHELFMNKMSLVTQFGYYTYYPIDFEGRLYQRVGLKYYLGNKLFSALTLKTHAAKAEAVEFGLGYRF
ncbi:acyloxyacyl hydrolase [Zhouia spongiae]|uniref:Acyloxyacyl hydrolase n=1 Tax=Zhouia spongiae TaxID=2202721 RepID=A0ABY3YMW7_9FLAO|nr:acyloxyacyl hydrolase [Zhouia spongiae]UNY99124.1 acyloxyacyl hydrolase [Zhouia spongiae]